jgi:hypothetical protein
MAPQLKWAARPCSWAHGGWAGQFWPKAIVAFSIFPRDCLNQISSNFLKFIETLNDFRIDQIISKVSIQIYSLE